MWKLRTRRLASFVVTSILVAITWYIAKLIENRFGRPDFFTGYSLTACIALLFLLTLRKKLLVLRLGPISGWLQAHQYIGLFAVAVFFMHTGWPIHGWFESLLAATFLFISIGGMITWYLNRTIPKKLSILGSDVILEDIPTLRHRIAEQAYSIAVTSAGKIETATLAEHYGAKLVQFFQRPRSLAYVLIPSGRLRRKHIEALERLDRYLGEEGRSIRVEMCRLVRSKDDLDYQNAMQRRLKLWSALHQSCIWLFLVLLAMHIVLAHRFHGA